MLKLAIIACMFCCVVSQTPAQQNTDGITIPLRTRDAIQTLLGDLQVNGQAYEYTRELADEIGPRVSGSVSYLQATRWAQQRFKNAGLTNVHTEAFRMSVWLPAGAATGTVTSPFAHSLHIYAFAGSPSTPPEGVTAKIIHVPGLTHESLQTIKDSLRGNIAFVDGASLPPNPSYEDILRAIPELEQMHPKGLLIGDVLPKFIGAIDNGTEYVFALKGYGTMLGEPAAQVGGEDVQLIRRLMAKGDVEMTMNFSTQIVPNVEVPQVIGEIRGRELPDQIVLLGAHLDSWQPGTGAQDNATGVATVIDTARAIAQTHLEPRRTIRFVLFGGEEEGELGSVAYVKAHHSDIEKLDSVLITDTGAGTAYGWMVMGRSDQEQALKSVSSLLSNLGSEKTTNDIELESDDAAFFEAGVPTLVLWNDLTQYGSLHHRASDTFESINRGTLMQGVATTAVTTFAIADSPDIFAPHLSQAQLTEIVSKAGMQKDYDFQLLLHEQIH